MIKILITNIFILLPIICNGQTSNCKTCESTQEMCQTSNVNNGHEWCGCNDNGCLCGGTCDRPIIDHTNLYLLDNIDSVDVFFLSPDLLNNDAFKAKLRPHIAHYQSDSDLKILDGYLLNRHFVFKLNDETYISIKIEHNLAIISSCSGEPITALVISDDS